MDASIPSVVDLPDGSFELPPDPKSVQQIRRLLVACGAGLLLFEAGAGTRTSDNQFSGNQHNLANVP